MIPKQIHLTWKTKDLLEIESEFLDRTVKSLVDLSPDWKVTVNDDFDVIQYLKENLSKQDYENLEHRHIVEKTDVWRMVNRTRSVCLFIHRTAEYLKKTCLCAQVCD